MQSGEIKGKRKKIFYNYAAGFLPNGFFLKTATALSQVSSMTSSAINLAAVHNISPMYF